VGAGKAFLDTGVPARNPFLSNDRLGELARYPGDGAHHDQADSRRA